MGNVKISPEGMAETIIEMKQKLSEMESIHNDLYKKGIMEMENIYRTVCERIGVEPDEKVFEW